jgi:hypothetical protein
MDGRPLKFHQFMSGTESRFLNFSARNPISQRPEANMSQADLWNKAADCTRAIAAASDPVQREMLINLRTLWTNLANESPFLGNGLADQIATIRRLHDDLMPTATNKVTSTPAPAVALRSPEPWQATARRWPRLRLRAARCIGSP